MKHLLIIGARGWGREIFNMLPNCIGYGTDFIVKGFLDDKADALGGMSGYPPIIDSVENYEPQNDDVFTCALGDVNWRKHYAEIMLYKGGEFINIIHKTASLGPNSLMGKGCILSAHVGVSCDIFIGNFVTMQDYAIIGHDVRIGNYCGLGVRSFMGGYSSLGDCTMIQTHSVILPHMKIGNNCLVGAGSVVIKKVKDGDTVYGNPAKVLKY
jgi:sugar O-acyltransferase (sialic acid O-acetyltransferase NeuD family)